jgi:hypothetical protein
MIMQGPDVIGVFLLFDDVFCIKDVLSRQVLLDKSNEKVLLLV